MKTACVNQSYNNIRYKVIIASAEAFEGVDRHRYNIKYKN